MRQSVAMAGRRAALEVRAGRGLRPLLYRGLPSEHNESSWSVDTEGPLSPCPAMFDHRGAAGLNRSDRLARSCFCPARDMARWSEKVPQWFQMCGDCRVVGPLDVYGGASGPIVRPVASAATAARKVAGGVRCAH